jgi:hypothetical protein
MQYTKPDVQELISVEEQTFDRSGLVPPLFDTAKELARLVPAFNEFKSDSISAQPTTSLRRPNRKHTIQTQNGHASIEAMQSQPIAVRFVHCSRGWG